MREAAVRNTWQKANEKERRVVPLLVRYENVFAVGSGEYDFASGFLNLLVGGSGVGKIFILRTVEAAFRPDLASGSSFAKARLRGATLIATLMIGGVERTIKSVFGETGSATVDADVDLAEVSVAYFDVGADVARIRDWAKRTSLPDVLEGTDPSVAQTNQLKRLRRLARKDYLRSKTYEVEVLVELGGATIDTKRPAGRSDVFPYFRALGKNEADTEYGIDDMGFGEAIAHYLVWCLTGMAKDSILLLDEPGTHLPDAAQILLLDEIAMTVVRSGGTYLLTTHSARMIREVSPNQLRVMSRASSGLRIDKDPSLQITRFALGIEIPRSCLVGCEDKVAAQFVEACLKLSGSRLLWEGDVTSVGDASKVKSLVALHPVDRGWFRAIGVLDGDQRPATPGAPTPLRLVFLPGNESPERWLQDICTQQHDEVAAKLAILGAEFTACQTQLTGIDPHDWLENLATMLSRNVQDVVQAILGAAWTNNTRKNEILEFVSSLEYLAPTQASVAEFAEDDAPVIEQTSA